MNYTLGECVLKVNLLCDKMGSDYFTTPSILEVFRTHSLDFINEKLRIVEKNFEIIEDIANLIVPGNLIITADTNEMGPPREYISAVPVNLMRLLSYAVKYSDGSVSRMANFERHGERYVSANNPNRKPHKYYPTILREEGIFRILCGTAVPATMKIKYCKKPTIAKSNQQDLRIINLNDSAIEEILLKTVTRLFHITSDEREQSSYQLQEAFKQVFK